MPKAKYNELVAELKSILHEPGMRKMILLFENSIEDWKEDLVTAKGDQVIELQGAIIHVRDILTDLHRTIKRQDFKSSQYNSL